MQQELAALENEVAGLRQLHERLRESEERFRGAFDNAAIGMAIVSPQGRWLQVNQSLCEIVGYSEQELLSMTFQDVTHPEDLDLDLHNVEQMLRGRLRSYHMEKRYIRKDGHTVWVLLSVSLVHDKDGEPLHFVSQIQDVNARKLAQAARDSLIDQLQQALEHVRHLRTLVPVCAWCDQIRDASGNWAPFDAYLRSELKLKLTHGICPACSSSAMKDGSPNPKRS
ncbi:MAG: PAS domain S-box protein [Gemmataceae bacterium]|nr:PAS domain S-box protein [Gemmataceae bacterium]